MFPLYWFEADTLCLYEYIYILILYSTFVDIFSDKLLSRLTFLDTTRDNRAQLKKVSSALHVARGKRVRLIDVFATTDPQTELTSGSSHLSVRSHRTSRMSDGPFGEIWIIPVPPLLTEFAGTELYCTVLCLSPLLHHCDAKWRPVLHLCPRGLSAHIYCCTQEKRLKTNSPQYECCTSALHETTRHDRSDYSIARLDKRSIGFDSSRVSILCIDRIDEESSAAAPPVLWVAQMFSAPEEVSHHIALIDDYCKLAYDIRRGGKHNATQSFAYSRSTRTVLSVLYNYKTKR